MYFISVMRSCIFSIITPVFSVTWSSEIILIYWFAAQETILIIINVENRCSSKYFNIPKITSFKSYSHLYSVHTDCLYIYLYVSNWWHLIRLWKMDYDIIG